MEERLSVQEEREYWKLITEELMEKEEAKDFSKWGRAKIKNFGIQMEAKLLPLCISDPDIQELCRMDLTGFDVSEEDKGIKNRIDSTFRNLFVVPRVNTTHSKFKNRFAIYLGYKSADDFIRKHGIQLKELSEDIVESNFENKVIEDQQLEQLVKLFKARASRIRRVIKYNYQGDDMAGDMGEFDSLHEDHIKHVAKGEWFLAEEARRSIWRLNFKLLGKNSNYDGDADEWFYFGDDEGTNIYLNYFYHEEIEMEEHLIKDKMDLDKIKAFYLNILKSHNQ